VFCALLLLSAPLLAEVRDTEGYTLADINAKTTKFGHMGTAGFVMLGFGLAALGGAIPLMATADWETQSTGPGVSATTSDANGGVGIVLLALSIPLTVVGTVLGTIGSHKHHEYGRRAQVFPQVSAKKDEAGLRLVVRF
jgi:branched-subunit amino acid permease